MRPPLPAMGLLLPTNHQWPPLRILFCGSDDFSCVSLRALVAEQKRNPDVIESIDVLTRPSKPFGRGLKTMRELPVKTVAGKLKLPVHEVDRVTDWKIITTPTGPVNMLIAVSFGLFVPFRIINALGYGGLNLHPSLLPELQGPAPIHHAMLGHHRYTGVTLQTLSPEGFDKGRTLRQTAPPYIPVGPGTTLHGLSKTLADEGAGLLIDYIRSGTYRRRRRMPRESPSDSDPSSSSPPSDRKPSRAPKLSKRDAEVRWTDTTADDIVLQARVLGALWTRIHRWPKEGQLGPGSAERLVLGGLSAVSRPSPEAATERDKAQFLVSADEGDAITVTLTYMSIKETGAIVVLMKETGEGGKDGANCLQIEGITVGGRRGVPAAQAMKWFSRSTAIKERPR